jgi:hypothetical protein
MPINAWLTTTTSILWNPWAARRYDLECALHLSHTHFKKPLFNLLLPLLLFCLSLLISCLSPI